MGIPHMAYTCHTHTYTRTHTYMHIYTLSIAYTTVLYALTLLGPSMTLKEAEETLHWAPKAAVACIHPQELPKSCLACTHPRGSPKAAWPAPAQGLTIVVQQHVLWLEVTVDNASLMQVLQATDDLCRVVDGSWFRKAGVLLIHIVDVVPGGRTPREARTWAEGR